MFNLLKSDIYRLVHGKMLWVAAIVLVALSVLAAGMMHWVSSPEFRDDRERRRRGERRG